MIGSSITDEERRRISSAIQRAEEKTSGEIYVVVDRADHGYPVVPVLWGAMLALLVPWPLYFLTHLQPTLIFLLQAVAFVVVAVAASMAPLHRCFVPGRIAGHRARETAEAMFMAHGVHLTMERTGVLIYVALLDRRVEIVADENIDNKVNQNNWDDLAREVAAAARAKRLADGLISVIDRAGQLLAQHFPAGDANPNELPDRIVEI
jgi:putative membrane protein